MWSSSELSRPVVSIAIRRWVEKTAGPLSKIGTGLTSSLIVNRTFERNEDHSWVQGYLYTDVTVSQLLL